MNYKTVSAKKRNIIEFINKKETNNLQVKSFINELVGEHIIYFMREDKINVNRY